MPPTDVTLAVLAGGAGTRMGKPKALLTIRDEPILQWLIRKLNWPGPTLLVTAPLIAHPPGAEAFDAEAIDPVDGNGPLQGVHTGLLAATTPLVIFTPVDMPGVDRPMLQWLLDQLTDAHAGVMGKRGDQIEPFPCVLRRSVIDRVESRLQTGRRSVFGLSHEPDIAAVPTPIEWPSDRWLNLNFPSDYETFHSGPSPAGGG